MMMLENIICLAALLVLIPLFIALSKALAGELK